MKYGASKIIGDFILSISITKFQAANLKISDQIDRTTHDHTIYSNQLSGTQINY